MKLIFVALSFFFFSCKDKIGQNKEIKSLNTAINDTLIIKLSIKDKNRFYYYDDFENTNYLNFSDNILVLDHDYFELIDGKNKISYILKKGERVKIVDNGFHIKIVCNDTTRVSELHFPIEYYKKFDSTSVNIWSFQKSYVGNEYVANTQIRDSILLKEHVNSENFLKEYQKKYKLSKEFYYSYQKIIMYKILEKKLMALNDNYNFSKIYTNNIATNSIHILNDDKFLFLKNYRNCIYTLLHFLKRNEPSKGYLELINESFENQTRYFLLGTVIVNSNKTYSPYNISSKEKQNLSTYFFEKSQIKRYNEYVKKSIEIDNIKLEKDEFINLKNEKIAFAKINNSKLTYLDFWASWCAPCRAEMPDSRKLSEEYKKRGVNFVYISIDENAAAWDRASKQIGLPETNSYLLPDSKNSAITKKFNISTIPRYLIIDQTGKIINSDAPRPSDPKIKNIFDQLLK